MAAVYHHLAAAFVFYLEAANSPAHGLTFQNHHGGAGEVAGAFKSPASRAEEHYLRDDVGRRARSITVGETSSSSCGATGKAVFVHVMKTAGLTINKYINCRAGKEGWSVLHTEGERPHREGTQGCAPSFCSLHQPMREKASSCGQSFENASTFTLLREPVSRAFSFYNFMREQGFDGYLRHDFKTVVANYTTLDINLDAPRGHRCFFCYRQMYNPMVLFNFVGPKTEARLNNTPWSSHATPALQAQSVGSNEPRFIPDDQLMEEALKEAKANLDKLSGIYFMEDLPNFPNIFSKEFRSNPVAGEDSCVMAHANPTTYDSVLTEAEIHHFKKLNRWDIELYEYAHHLRKRRQNKGSLRTRKEQASSLLQVTKPSSQNHFKDVSAVAFPPQWYTWNHSGYPRSHQGTPSFPDFNGDGVLDYLYHNHYQGNPTTDWDVGISLGSNNPAKGPFFQSVGRKMLVNTEPVGSKWRTENMDTHGTTILDIDRDGVLDIYMAVGGGEGFVSGPAKNAVLMWGELEDGHLRFAGGRHVSESAKLHNPDSRGRFNYFADLNGDGLLDVIHANDPRSDTIHAPGYALLNMGNRSFKRLGALNEYTETMLLTDANGDGSADELVVQRRDCPYKKCTYANDMECKSLMQDNLEWYNFCLTHPRGTAAVYKWDHAQDDLVMISEPRATSSFGAPDHGTSMQSGDFDEDGIADLAVLHRKGIDLFYSSKRKQANELMLSGTPHEKIRWGKACTGNALRAADLNLDGRVELIVACKDVTIAGGVGHRLYSQEGLKWKLHSDKLALGDLLNTELVHPDPKLLAKECHGLASTQGAVYKKKICKEFENKAKTGQFAVPRTMGLSVIDWNNDGFSDIVMSYDLGNLILLENNNRAMGNNNQFIAFRLRGTKSNSHAVGATILLMSRNMDRGSDGARTVTQLREISSASHETDWLGTKDDRVIFGLGAAGVPVKVTVRWPSVNGLPPQEHVIEDERLLAEHSNSMTRLLMITETMD